MMQKSINILVILSLLSFMEVSFGQSTKLARAEKAFDKYAFIDSREIYLKVIEEGYSSAQVYNRLGDTYYFNSDYKNAAKWYARSIEEYPAQADPDYYYKAAISHRSIGELEKSALYLSTFWEERQIKQGYTINSAADSLLTFKGFQIKSLDNINTDNSDFGTSMNGDKLVFASSGRNKISQRNHAWNENAYLDLFVATRDATGKFSDIEPMKGEVNSPYHESTPTFGKISNVVFFTRNNFQDGKRGRDKKNNTRLKIYKASLDSAGEWTNIKELPFNGDAYSAAHPALSPDEKRLYFASDMPGTLGMSDLWYVDILDEDSYGDPVNLGPNINTVGRESFPFISAKNNLYFSSDTHYGKGGFDIFYSELDANNTYSKIQSLGKPINSNQDDFGFSFDEENQIGYLSSNRNGEMGNLSDDIFQIERKCFVSLSGTVVSSLSDKPLPQTEVVLFDLENKPIAKVISDDNGLYVFGLDLKCSEQYRIQATNELCETFEKMIITPREIENIVVDITLECGDCAIDDLGCRLNLQPIYFDFDKWNIRPDAEVELAKILTAMDLYPSLNIHIESHTDSRGTKAYNRTLSDRRAKSTLEWLVSKGIDRSRLTSKGYGEEQLINVCFDGKACSEEEHQLNRRSMFKIQ